MRSIPAALTVVAALALLVSGCASDEGPDTAATPRPSVSLPSGPSPEATQATEPTTVPPSTPKPIPATPVSIACNDLVSLQAVYDYNPNYGNQPKFSPPAGSNAARVGASDGTVCNWVNQTSGETFIVAVAQPASGELATLRAAASAGATVNGLGDSAFFDSRRGETQVFSGPYWVVASSSAFESAETAKPLIKSALSSLGR